MENILPEFWALAMNSISVVWCHVLNRLILPSISSFRKFVFLMVILNGIDDYDNGDTIAQSIRKIEEKKHI